MPKTRFEDSTVNTTEQNTSEPAASPANFVLPPYTLAGPIISPCTTTPQAEQHVALDPVSPTHIVAAISDFADVHQGRNVTKYVVSVDNGATWFEKYMDVDAGGFLRTSDGRRWDANSDPVLAIHRSGKVYLTNLYLNGVFNQADMSNGIYCSVGDLASLPNPLDGFDAAHTFPVNVNPSPAAALFNDKQWIAVDNSGLHGTSATDGFVYIAWTRFANSDNAIRLTRSTNQGRNWSAPIKLNPSNQNGHLQGVQVQVGPQGQVYVLWELTTWTNTRQIWFVRSLDAGVTWRQPHQITKDYNTVNFGSSYRTNSFSKIRVDQNNGTIHLVWPDMPSFTLGGSINYSHSTDGGVSWSPRVRLNDVTGFQAFMPSIAVDDAGRAHATWYDTRNSGASPGISRFYDVYGTYSNGDSSWATNKRITDSIVDTGVGERFIGDYNSLRAMGGFIHPIWTNGGFNGGSLKTRLLTIP